MGGAEVLPFAGAHLGTRLRRTWRFVSEETNRHQIRFLGEESTQLVQPNAAINTRRRLGQGLRACFVQCDARGLRLRVVQCLEVFGQLEGGIDLSAFMSAFVYL